MQKNLLSVVALALTALQPALAQSPWVAPPTGPVYEYNYTVSSSIRYLHSPQRDVLWAKVEEGAQSGPGTRIYQDKIFSTSDNGKTWQVASKTPLGDISAVDANHAWALQSTSTSTSLLRTTSGPAGFTKMDAVLPANFFTIHFFTTTIGIALPIVQATAATWPIYRTTDGGATWTLVPNSPVTNNVAPYVYHNIEKKQSIGSSLWLAADSDHLLRTADMGLTWTSTPNASAAVFESELQGINFLVPAWNSNLPRRMLRTSNGGLTWTEISYTGTPGSTSMTAIAGRPGTYLSYDFSYPGASNLANGTTTVSYDWGASWQTLDTKIVSGVMEKLVSAYPGQLWAGVKGEYGGPNRPMVLQYSNGPLLGSKKTADPARALTAYPNPTTGLLHLQGPLQGPETVQVYDAAGRRCLSQTISQAQPTIDLSTQPAGLYQVQVTSATGTVRHLRVSKTQ